MVVASTNAMNATGDSISPSRPDIAGKNNNNNIIYYNINNNNDGDFIEDKLNASKESTGPSDSSNLTLDDSTDDDQQLVDESNEKNQSGGEVIDVEENLIMDHLTSSQHSLYSHSQSSQLHYNGNAGGLPMNISATVEELERKVRQHETDIQNLRNIINDLTNQVSRLQENQREKQSNTRPTSLGQRNRSLSSLSALSTPINSNNGNINRLRAAQSRPSISGSATMTRQLSANPSAPRSYSSMHSSPLPSGSAINRVNTRLTTYRRMDSKPEYAINDTASLYNGKGKSPYSVKSPTLWAEDDPYATEETSYVDHLLPSARNKSSRASSVSNLSVMTNQDRSSSIADFTSQLLRNSKIRDTLIDLNSGVIRLILNRTVIEMHIPTRLLPDYTPTQLVGLPQARLKLSWIYGYRGRDCRSNLHFLPTGECVYFIGCVVVLYNIDDGCQRHYLGHTSEIKCIAIHQNRLTVVTGQAAIYRTSGDIFKMAQIRVWNSVSLATIHVIDNFKHSISCLAFSRLNGGSILAAVDDSGEHIISMWDWQSGQQVAEARDGPDVVLAIEFHPIDHFKLITCGKNHIHFWDTEDFMLTKRPGLYDCHDKPKFVLCLTFTDTGEIVSGDSNGSIVAWPLGSNRPERFVQRAHDGGVFSILTLQDRTFITGGGKDRRIVEWDANLMPTGREAQLPEKFGGVRALCIGKKNNILIGTTKNCLLQGNMNSGFFLVMQGHVEPPLALAVHPTQDQYVVGGEDKQLSLFDSISHTIVWSKCMSSGVACACFSPDGQILVVGSDNGLWNVVDVDTHEIIFACSDGPTNSVISCAKFSPSGEMLALGSSTGYVYIYGTGNAMFSRIGACVGHKSPINHVDWSTDGQYLQTQGLQLEMMVWQATMCHPLTDIGIERNLQWASQNCTAGFNVYGIWQDGQTNSLFTDCDRTNDHKLLAVASDSGTIRLYKWPSNTQHCLHHTFLSGSQRIDMLRFSPNGSKLFAIASDECIVSEWNVEI